MFFPEQLYQLGTRDVAIAWLTPLLNFQSGSLASASLALNFTVPNDYNLVLKHLWGQGVGGGTQFVSRRELTLQSPTQDITLTLADDPTDGPAATEFGLSWIGEILLPPNWVIRTVITFNAGVSVNNIEQHIIGMLIPKANVQRV